MVDRRESVTLSFLDADYDRLRRLGHVVRGLALVATAVGVALLIDILRHRHQLGERPPGSVALSAVIILIWLGVAIFAFLVSRDARDATDTHVVLEVAASLAAGGAVVTSLLLGLIGGFWVISADTWKVVSFALAWLVGFAVYARFGEHLRRLFKLERKLSPPARWLIVAFAITVWIALTALTADLVGAAVEGDWHESWYRFVVLIPPIPAAIGLYLFGLKKLHPDRRREKATSG
jgi:hypothetical protein